MDFSSKLPLSLLFFFLVTISAYAHDSPQHYLDVHNAARGLVGVPPIAWDATVAEYAQNYANERKLDKYGCELMLSHGKYGEVILRSYSDMSGADAVKLWVAERVYYDYNTNTCVGGSCHEYTQVVWRNSTHLGCAKVNCDAGPGVFIICNYDPPGNVEGERPY